MGNLCASCSNHDGVSKSSKAPGRRLPGPASTSGRGFSRIRSSRRDSNASVELKLDDPVLREQALAAAAIILQQHRSSDGGALPFDRSASHRYPPRNTHSGGGGGKNQLPLPRSSSSRARSLTDPLLQPHQLVNQDRCLEELETTHFVLVHGGGFGAWCWYKTIALLEEAGFQVTAIDLTGSGIHSSNTNEIQSLAQYVNPLTDFLEKLPEGDKVILVGHDFGGACISYAMELFAPKISKAVFLAAAMLVTGQSALDMFSAQAESNDLMKQAQIFVYANGKDGPPTAIGMDKSLLKDLLFNQSPQKDVALASVSMRPIPFAPVLEKLSLTDENYGSVRRYYIATPDDNAIPIAVQEKMVNESQPEKVFRLKGSDHSPFFSKPQALHKLLLEISKIPPHCS